jgi:cytochrome c55X
MANQFSRQCALLALAMYASCAPGADPRPDDAALSGARRLELVRLVRNDCGSCHGLTLAGGLGPALLPEALRGKSVEGLTGIILNGRPGTAMPPWSRFLSVSEAEWVVTQLKEGFPDAR